jgi:histidine triad (HIT) family protein
MEKDCLFCKIINKEISSEIVYEDNEVLAFKDIKPKAAFHILILPKTHIESVNHLEIGNKELAGSLFLAAQKIAKEKNLTGYKLAINVGRKGGQLIDHLHLHLLGGEIKGMP